MFCRIITRCNRPTKTSESNVNILSQVLLGKYSDGNTWLGNRHRSTKSVPESGLFPTTGHQRTVLLASSMDSTRFNVLIICGLLKGGGGYIGLRAILRRPKRQTSS